MIVTLPGRHSRLVILNADRIVSIREGWTEGSVLTVDAGSAEPVEYEVIGTPGDVAYDINSQVAAV